MRRREAFLAREFKNSFAKSVDYLDIWPSLSSGTNLAKLVPKPIPLVRWSIT
jgi:hypothetical protein